MTGMEQAIRDEIAWHEDKIRVGPPYAWSTADHRARLAALTAALPVPGDAGEWVMVPRVATEVMISRGNQEIDWCRSEQISTQNPSDRHPSGVGSTQAQDIQDAWTAMIAAAPSPSSTISQAQAMREALEKIAAARYGIEVGASDEEWEQYWRLTTQRYRSIARAALAAVASVPDAAR